MAWLAKRYGSDTNNSDNDNNSDDKKKGQESIGKKSKDEVKQAALEKLNSLLSSMKVSSSFSDEYTTQPIQLATPVNRRKKPKQEVEEKADVNTIEEQEAEKVSKPEEQGLEPELQTAVTDVARMFGDVEGQVKHELTRKLKEYAEYSTDGSKDESSPPRNIGDLFAGMKVEKNKDQLQAQMDSRADSWVKASHQVGERLRSSFPQGSAPPRQRMNGIPGKPQKVDLESGLPLNIFSKDLQKSPQQEVKLKIWDRLLQEEKQLLLTHPPRNALEEMIMWTKQGKIWKFPIDNEQGMDEEANTGFHEHVFLDNLLDGFPKKGPIALFMELVCIGLSKNPYLSVKQKKEHIDWFRQYFKEKESVLKEVGAIV
jgi:small subunit ribosomal protein S31